MSLNLDFKKSVFEILNFLGSKMNIEYVSEFDQLYLRHSELILKLIDKTITFKAESHATFVNMLMDSINRKVNYVTSVNREKAISGDEAELGKIFAALLQLLREREDQLMKVIVEECSKSETFDERPLVSLFDAFDEFLQHGHDDDSWMLSILDEDTMEKDDFFIPLPQTPRNSHRHSVFKTPASRRNIRSARQCQPSSPLMESINSPIMQQRREEQKRKAAERKMFDMEDIIVELQKKNEELVSSKSELTTRYVDIKNSEAALKIENERLNSELTDISEKFDTTKRQLNSLQEQSDNLKKSQKKTNMFEKDLEEVVKTYTARIAELEKEVRNSKKNFNDMCDEFHVKNQELQKNMAEKCAAVSSAQVEITELEEKMKFLMERSESEIKALENELEVKNQEASQLQQQNAQLSTHKKNSDEVLAANGLTIEKLQSQIGMLKQTHADALQNVEQEYSTRFTNMEKQLQAVKNNNALLQQQLQEVESREKSAKEALMLAEKDKSQKATEESAQDLREVNLEISIKRLHERVSQLNGQIDINAIKHQREMDMKNDEISALETAQKRTVLKLQEVQAELEDSKAETVNVNELLDQANSLASAKYREYRLTIKEYEAEIDALKAEKAELEQKLAQEEELRTLAETKVGDQCDVEFYQEASLNEEDQTHVFRHATTSQIAQTGVTNIFPEIEVVCKGVKFTVDFGSNDGAEESFTSEMMTDRQSLASTDCVSVVSGTSRATLPPDFKMKNAEKENEDTFSIGSRGSLARSSVASSFKVPRTPLEMKAVPVDELKRRNMLQAPAQRCSYFIETQQRDSPTTSENAVRNPAGKETKPAKKKRRDSILSMALGRRN